MQNGKGVSSVRDKGCARLFMHNGSRSACSARVLGVSCTHSVRERYVRSACDWRALHVLCTNAALVQASR
eukprot:6177955-Pleurochrysis_carterae.AAC.13